MACILPTARMNKGRYVPDEGSPKELVQLYMKCQYHYGRGNNSIQYLRDVRFREFIATGPPTGDEENPTQRYRPLPQDANVPPGFERRNGMIVPERPKTSGVQYEGQHPDDTQEEHLVRIQEARWRATLFLSSITLIVLNVAVFILGVIGQEIEFPIGILPLPALIWSLMARNKKANQLSKMKRDREEETIKEMLSSNRPPAYATTTVTR